MDIHTRLMITSASSWGEMWSIDILPMPLRQGTPTLTSELSCFNEACPHEP